MSGLNPFYKQEGDKVVCLLCRHHCRLEENQVGVCGVNKNERGKLVNLVYGRVSGINIDPIEKKPLYHFLPGTTSLSIGTVGCNFKCPFCQNWQLSQNNNIGNAYELTPGQLVDLALKHGCKSISYTYNEPTIFYPFARDVALLAREQGIKNVFVSNGFESPEIIKDMVGVIDGFNIDLKSFNTTYYKKVLKGGLEGVLDTLKQLKSKNFWLEVTTLIVPGDNDSSKELSKIASFIANELDINTPWHISAFHPDYKVQDRGATPVDTLQKAYDIGKQAGLNFIYLGNVSGPSSVTYCPSCDKELVERVGFNLVENNLLAGKCPKCNTAIPGVWR